MDIRYLERYKVRTQSAFVRSLKSFHTGTSGDFHSAFNVRSILRINDLNPPIFVCAVLLLDAEVEEDPAVIRETEHFKTLVERLGVQQDPNRTSLVLLEVFIYMILIHRARSKTAAQGVVESEQQELL